jgi:hypothetical protein
LTDFFPAGKKSFWKGKIFFLAKRQNSFGEGEIFICKANFFWQAKAVFFGTAKVKVL